MKNRLWLIYSLVTTAFWGVWGALIELPEKAGFPATLSYAVWALTMIPPALVALKAVGWRLERDRRSIALGLLIGLLGAGGQVVLFQALRVGPAYLIFPIISLSPVVTILMSWLLLKERASRRGWVGIFAALAAIPLLSYSGNRQEAAGALWFVLALLVFFAWGVQAWAMKFANETMKAESIFFYMTVSGLLVVPAALLMTDFGQAVNWGPRGPYLAAVIQSLNSVGALCLVYAFRYGKAIIVSPLTNAVAPVITIIISLAIYSVVPHPLVTAGMVLAILSTLLLALEGEGAGEAPAAGAGPSRLETT
ncbi:MAG TPA: DMT family transporter [Pyrinomonadaceae bacterium]|jgi:drug/metabolite transporter (DMT)-like permease